MKCNCCGRKKKLFESFEAIDCNINVCVECGTLLYKLRDSKAEKNEVDFKRYLMMIDERRSNNSTKSFESWYNTFIKSIK